LSDSTEGTEAFASSKADWGGVVGIFLGGMMMMPWLFMDGEPVVSSHAAPYVALLAAGGAVVTLVGIALTILANRDVDRMNSGSASVARA